MSERATQQILMILTSHEHFGGQDSSAHGKTGIWLESFVAPYFILRDAGIDLTLASPLGGKPPVDPASRAMSPAVARRFAEDECCRTALADTLTVQDIYAVDFDAVFYVGGYGCYWDLATDTTSAKLIANLHATGKPVALVAQAVAALCSAQDTSGRPLVAGKHVTGFSDHAAIAAGMSDILPFSLEQQLGQLGALYRRGPDPDCHVLQDGLLITGETVATSDAVAHSLLQAITPRTDTHPH